MPQLTEPPSADRPAVETGPRPSPHTINYHAYCTGCGYDLCGLPQAGRCPECGTQRLFARRLKMADLDPDRLGAIDDGCTMKLVSIALTALSATPLVMFALQHGGAWLFSPLLLLSPLTSRMAVSRWFARPSTWLRLFEWALLGGGCLFIVSIALSPDVQSPSLAGLAGAIATLLFFASIGHSIVLYSHLAQLARDLGRPALADDIARLRWMKIGSNAALFFLAACALFALSVPNEEAAIRIGVVGALAWLTCICAWIIEFLDVWRLKSAVDVLISR